MLARIRKAQDKESGFTLIELLVVIIIIGILAAIAIPTFLNQRQKGYKADMKSTAKNVATAVESYATETGGLYTGISYNDVATNEGAKKAASQTVTVSTSADKYCIFVLDTRLSTRAFKYTSVAGAPVEVAAASTCTSPADF